MLILYISFAYVLYFSSLYIARNDENKNVQSYIVPLILSTEMMRQNKLLT